MHVTEFKVTKAHERISAIVLVNQNSRLQIQNEM